MKNYFQEFKTPLVTIFLIFLGLAIYTKVFGPIPFYINSTNTTKTDLFSSSGSGEVSEVPDTAQIYIGVTKNATTVQDAQNQVNEISKKIISDLKTLGIKDKDIKTTSYNVNPNYNNSEPLMMGAPAVAPAGNPLTVPARTSGYEVTQNIEVKIKPIENVNKIIDLATKNGANLVGGVNFTFSEELQKELEKKATEIAVKEAKEKAELLANSAGVKLGKISNIISSDNGYNIRPMMAFEQKADTANTVPTEITPGQNTISVSVTIYYETY